jgi:1-acyl-sn-glycerol-3-phosphate acyltransferase
MRKELYNFIYKHVLGWKYKISVPKFDKCVICAAPHTTNYDLFIGKLFYGTIGKKANFLIKKEWFFFPMNYIFHLIGGIPVDRRHKTSLTEQMVRLFSKRKEFTLAITPEATRAANPNWKKGFYYIALEAKVPIVLIGIDYSTKTIAATKYLWANGDIESQMQEIKHYFTKFRGKHPERFAI